MTLQSHEAVIARPLERDHIKLLPQVAGQCENWSDYEIEEQLRNNSNDSQENIEALSFLHCFSLLFRPVCRGCGFGDERNYIAARVITFRSNFPVHIDISIPCHLLVLISPVTQRNFHRRFHRPPVRECLSIGLLMLLLQVVVGIERPRWR